MHPTQAFGRLALGLVAACCLIALGGCENGAGPSSERLTLRPLGSIDGAPAGYAEYLPPGYGDGTKRPLLLALDGSGSNGNGGRSELGRVLQTGVPKLIRHDDWPAERPFIVLMPQHSANGSDPCPGPAEIESFLDYALHHYDVDRSRVYLTGLSCGAIGAWNYLAVHTDERVAAAVLIAGDGTEALLYGGCGLARVPIWAVHGAADGTVDASGSVDTIDVLEACADPEPADLRLTVYPGVGHDSWDRTYDLSAGNDIYSWLLTHEHS